ncbi:conserved hypothetical protein [uncultured Pleomorphomonas sp.]|uniref:HTH gntR-type domain-containing protein n=1 Tax=uncultured Pleomorphomonas sp. TaxID=442121 RepID=A0A212LFP7_9HYPH|nr:GntR family transcriptional regulator [uncultured Pleomorphomonas sp.]SCM76308.1 conserved hypothetical protein [uncultured Pleomorphomonas sp.]
MTILQKVSLAEQIAVILQERIIAGEFPGDAPLRQDELAAEFGVSKIPLREAFAKLEQTGLITSQINRGFFIRPLTADEAQDVFDLRLRIEPDATARGALHAGDGDVALARKALEALNAAISDHASNVGPLNRAFHMALVRPIAAPISKQTLERVHVISERYVVRHLAPIGRSERAESEHAAIFDAWKVGDAEAVRRVSQAHIAATWDDLRSEFDGGA